MTNTPNRTNRRLDQQLNVGVGGVGGVSAHARDASRRTNKVRVRFSGVTDDPALHFPSIEEVHR